MEGVVADPNAAAEGNGTEEMPAELMEKYHIMANVKGQMQPVSLTNIRDNAQKELAGDARLREAHDAESALNTDVERGRALTAAVESDGDVEVWRRALRTAGMTDDQIVQAFSSPQGAAPATNVDASTASTQSDDGQADDRYDILSGSVEELKGAVEQLIGVHNQAKRDSGYRAEQTEIKRALESDQELSKLLTGTGKDGREFILDTAFRAVEKAKKTLPWGPRAIQQGLDEARRLLKGVGAKGMGSEDNQPPEQYGATDHMQAGLGATGHSVGRFHRTSTQDKPVDVRDEGYSMNVFQRLAAGMRKKD